MGTRLLSFWFSVRYSFWFIPTVMVIAATILAIAAERIDRAIGDGADSTYWVYGGSADGARQMLATIAGSSITVAGLVFSITITTLTLASQQFGPRLLRNFMRDRGNQFVLGTFIATFVYCLLILRQVRGGDEAFVPGTSIGIAIALAVMSLGVLIYFIHHTASAIQANSIIASVGEDLEDAIDHLFPERIGAGAQHAERNVPGDDELARGFPVMADRSGYIEAIDEDRIMSLAGESNTVIRLYKRPGHYVVADAEIARVLPAAAGNDEFRHRLNGAFLLADTRSVEQDVEFAIDQLVEIAARALSPGINDPFTAMVCIDRLTSAMVRVMGREMPSRYRQDDEGQLRVVAEVFGFEGMLDAAFNAVRQYGATHVSVTIRLLEALTTLMKRATTDDQRHAIQRHADMVVRSGRENIVETNDREDLEGRYAELERVAGTSPGA